MRNNYHPRLTLSRLWIVSPKNNFQADPSLHGEEGQEKHLCKKNKLTSHSALPFRRQVKGENTLYLYLSYRSFQQYHTLRTDQIARRPEPIEIDPARYRVTRLIFPIPHHGITARVPDFIH